MSAGNPFQDPLPAQPLIPGKAASPMEARGARIRSGQIRRRGRSDGLMGARRMGASIQRLRQD